MIELNTVRWLDPEEIVTVMQIATGIMIAVMIFSEYAQVGYSYLSYYTSDNNIIFSLQLIFIGFFLNMMNQGHITSPYHQIPQC